jgi:hypothetical protein
MKRISVLFMALLSVALQAAAAGRGTFKSVYAAQDVELETDPQSAFWRGARSVHAEVNKQGRVVPGYRTEVRSRWTKTYLYLLFECPYEELYLKPQPNLVEETNQLWNWDVAELFIGSDFENIRRYKEFEVSPQGEWIDLDVNLDLPDHTVGWTWNSGFEKAARIDAKAKVWYAAMKIPFAAIDARAPAAGRVFRANLFRSQGPPQRRMAIAWQAPMSDTFHAPEKFGVLKLVGR